ncbi:MAG TPA: helix-turn-helix domain-containing protein [Verrucomicrobiae bacterium]|jgi:hypothetical protein|nr:helix-turn-helix domain-containing protein [Verrucomicrobiae bacterium]
MRDRLEATFTAKWREESIVKRGFACVPKCLFTCMGELALKPQEAMLLINIIEKCWYEGDKAWPSVDYLAKNTGRKNSATRDSLRGLAKKGFISKEQRFNSSNLYGLEPCVQKLADHMLTCRHIAGSPLSIHRKSDGAGSRKTNDYIEAELIKPNDVRPNILRHHTKGDNELSLNVKNKRATCPATGDNHEWDDFEVERGTSTYYYKRCEYCDMTFSKKDKPPFGEDPTRFLENSTESYILADTPINLDEIDF